MLKVFESFAGIGTQRMGLERAGIDHEVVGICEIDKFAIDSYQAIHGDVNNYGDIAKIDPKDLPDFDLFTYSFPCFTESALVLTSQGYKSIKDIEVGDYVLTHDNTYKKVLNKFENGLKETFIIEGMSIDEIVTTENHKFYVRKRYRKWNNDLRRDVRLFEKPEWIEAKDLTRDHYLGMAINQESKIPNWEGLTFTWDTNIPQIGMRSRESNVIKPLLKNKSFWWLIGRYVADGWIRQPDGIVIAVGKHKLKEFEEKLNNIMNYTIVEERTAYKVHFGFKEIGEFVKPIGHGASNKRIPDFIIDLPVNLLKEFINGYISGDGYKNKNYYKLSTTSRELIYGLGQCIAKAYKRPYAIYKTIRPKKAVIEGRTVNQKDTYELIFKPEKGKQDKAFYEDGFIWYPFNKSYKGEKELVYDIEVEDNHSFTVQNTIVHNCQDLSMAGKQKGFEKGSGTRSSLLWECERIIQAKRPKYLLMENVKALTFKKNLPGFEKWLEILSNLGYKNYWKVLNSKDYGVPQNRERVFCISILDDKQGFEFPEKQVLETRLKDVLEHNVDEKYYLSNDRVKQLVGIVRNWGVKGKTVFDSSINEPKEKEVANCITTKQRGISIRKSEGNVVVEPELVQTHKLNNDKRDNPERYRVFDKEGLAPTLTCQTGNHLPQISIDLPAIAASRGRKKDEKYVQQLEFNKNGITNTLTTVEKDNYLVASDNNKSIPIKNGTKKGYLEAHQGDGIDLINVSCNNRRGRVQKDCSQTLTCNNDRGVVTDDFRIRKLTPLEFWRLMGIDDEDFYKARKVNSDSQLYKQAGNAIVVDVLAAIFVQLFRNKEIES